MKRITVERLVFTENEKEILEKAYNIIQELDEETNSSAGCSICPLALNCPSGSCAIRRCREELNKLHKMVEIE